MRSGSSVGSGGVSVSDSGGEDRSRSSYGMDNSSVGHSTGSGSRSKSSSVTGQSSSGHSGTTASGSGASGKKTVKEKLDEETGQALESLKQFGYRLVILGAIGLGLATYFLTYGTQLDSFQAAFIKYANEVAVVAGVNVDGVFHVMSDLSIRTTSTAAYTNANWPYYTIPNFETKATNTRLLADTSSLMYSPMIIQEDRTEWEAYSVVNQEKLNLQSNVPIPPRIHNVTMPLPPDDPGPFSPVWQVAPIPASEHVPMINFDLLQSASYSTLVQYVDNVTYRAAVSTVVNYNYQESEYYNKYLLFAEEHESDGEQLARNATPKSVLLQPIYTDLTPLQDNNAATSSGFSSIAGHYLTIVTWELYFQRILPGYAKGVIVVLSDSCGSGYTFEINGPTVTYIGPGDLHDPKYDLMVVTAPLTDASRTVDRCHFVLFVYPSEDLEALFMTNKPAIYTSVVVLVVFVTALCFALYDYFTKREEQRLLIKAERTHAIVTSLFPENVQQRMIDDAVAAKDKKQKQLNGRLGLRSYLADGLEDENGHVDLATIDFNSKPIADLFPETTVMFCDICGFTAWSSVREPVQIFTLLETIFTSFDALATRRGVFKVETVGDSYVAVSGLPDPRPDHALVMARFARECLACVQDLLPKLEVSLGPDTGDLAMRFGLHSGPVTAGVLRGEKARFQLFGDTMNTASRIETSSIANKIHLSQDTAELIIESGRRHWLELREDVVTLKGKGAMETYWLTPRSKTSKNGGSDVGTSYRSGTSGLDSSGHISLAVSSIHGGDEDEDDKGATEDELLVRQQQQDFQQQAMKNAEENSAAYQKIQRLIDWNVELLNQMIKKILARRRADKRLSMSPNVANRVRQVETELGTVGMVSDEVVEIIHMPEFDARAAKEEAEYSDSTQISEAAMVELRMYISMISSMYRDNPFHNFEHASHVTMSVSKLLARIVAPESVIDKSNHSNDDENLHGALHDHTYGITSDPMTQFAVVLSALIHDVDHRGVPNFVLIKEDPSLASCYKEKSVAEQNSVDLAWNTLMDPTFEVLRRSIYTNETELRRFRQLLVNSVMATDIFDKELGALRKQRWNKAFSESASDDEDAVDRKATIVLEHLIQASDVAHTMQHWHIYTKWNERLFEEMYSAHVMGRMDKDPSDGWYNGEIWFFDNYIIPLAKKLKECGVFGVSSDEYLNYAQRNRNEWEKKGENVVSKMADKMKVKYQATAGVGDRNAI